MKCGLFLPNFGAFGEARALVELAVEAEAAGWNGFFIWDHVARPLVTAVVDPWVALTAIAVGTHRMRIGALVTPLPRRRPWKVARETVSVDRLSGGRLVFGVGSGSGRTVEWDDLGEAVDARTRGAMLDEGLRVVTGLWRGEPFSFAGEHYRVAGAHFVPPPLQVPRIPVWVAGYWPNRAPFRRAARWDGMFPLFPQGGDERAQLRAVVDYVRRRAPSASFDVVYATPPGATATDLAAYAADGATWWLARIEPQHFGSSWEGAWDIDAMCGYVAAGPPR